MKTLRIFRQSLRSLARNKGRSFLTSLGIIIGIASVIALLAIGQGAQNSVTSRLSSLGTTTLTIRSGAGGFGTGGNRGGGGPGGERGGFGGGATSRLTLTPADEQSLQNNKTQFKLDKIAAYNITTETLSLAAKDASGNAVQQDFTVAGTEPDYFAIQNLNIGSGNLLTTSDVTAHTKVAVLGSDAATNLFGSVSPLGQTVTLNNVAYKVVGILQNKTESGFGNPNQQIYVPITSLDDTYSINDYSTIYVTAVDEASVDSAKSSIETQLQANHGKTAQTADFNVVSQKDLLATVSNASDTFKALLGGIAGISLVVGGIGIMNIMLVAVTERTREIGLRKAVGAKTRHILLQFVFESVLLCVFGGLVGVGLGSLVANSFGRVRFFGPGSFQASVTVGSIILAVTVSLIVGLVFGIYPAAKAARLNPIDALRYE